MIPVVSNNTLLLLRGKSQFKPHPDWCLLGNRLKFSDEHPRTLYMGVSPGLKLSVTFLLAFVNPVFVIFRNRIEHFGNINKTWLRIRIFEPIIPSRS